MAGCKTVILLIVLQLVYSRPVLIKEVHIKKKIDLSFKHTAQFRPHEYIRTKIGHFINKHLIAKRAVGPEAVEKPDETKATFTLMLEKSIEAGAPPLLPPPPPPGDKLAVTPLPRMFTPSSEASIPPSSTPPPVSVTENLSRLPSGLVIEEMVRITPPPPPPLPPIEPTSFSPPPVPKPQPEGTAGPLFQASLITLPPPPPAVLLTSVRPPPPGLSTMFMQPPPPPPPPPPGILMTPEPPLQKRPTGLPIQESLISSPPPPPPPPPAILATPILPAPGPPPPPLPAGDQTPLLPSPGPPPEVPSGPLTQGNLFTNIAKVDEINSYLNTIQGIISPPEQPAGPPVEPAVPIFPVVGNSIEEPTRFIDKLKGRFVKGSRLALYFGNVFLQVMSEVISSARSAIGQYSQPGLISS